MKRRVVRAALFLLLLGAVGAAAYEVVRIENALHTERTAARTFDEHVRRIVLALANLRTTEQAYVAIGQNEGFWIGRVADDLADLEENLSALRQSATSAAAADSLDAADSAIETFARMDMRAREYAKNGGHLMASDIIFTDGVETTTAAAAHLDAARVAEMEARKASLVVLQRRQSYAAGGAAAVAVLVAALLLPGGGGSRVRVRPDLMHGVIGAEHAVPKTATAQPLPQSGPAAVDARTIQADLRAAAQVCTEIARVVDGAELVGLMEKTALLLDATGIIVWMADSTGSELRPVLSHGYTNQALSRMGVIGRDGGNATAAAYRQTALQTVEGVGGSSGAIVAPLVASAGCIGVMAAEVRNGRESDAAVQSLAGIVAAQLAALFGNSVTEASTKTGSA